MLRVVMFFFLVAAMNGVFFLEQPSSSLIIESDRFKMLRAVIDAALLSVRNRLMHGHLWGSVLLRIVNKKVYPNLSKNGIIIAGAVMQSNTSNGYRPGPLIFSYTAQLFASSLSFLHHLPYVHIAAHNFTSPRIFSKLPLTILICVLVI
jgi:hypothetical protein